MTVFSKPIGLSEAYQDQSDSSSVPDADTSWWNAMERGERFLFILGIIGWIVLVLTAIKIWPQLNDNYRWPSGA